MIINASNAYVKNRVVKNLNVLKSFQNTHSCQGQVRHCDDNFAMDTELISLPTVNPHSNIYEILTSNNFGLRKKIIEFAFKYKKYIKKIPIFGNYVVKVKNAMLVNAQIPINIDYLLNQDGLDFISGLYRTVLGREPEQAVIDNYYKSILQGFPKEGYVYLICTSDEYGRRAPIINLDMYKQSYSKYLRYERLKRIPLLGKCFVLLLLPSRIRLLTDHLYKAENKIASLESIIANSEGLNRENIK